MRSLPILRIRTTTLAVMALAAVLLSSDWVAADAAPWADENPPVCAETADPWAWIGSSTVPDIPMGEADDAEDCDVYRETVLEVAPHDESVCTDAPATYSLLANGLQAVVPPECFPSVSVGVEGVPVDYALQGVRLVMPSAHTLGGSHFAAEVQFVHEARTASFASSMVVAVWISNVATDEEADEDADAAGMEFLDGLVDAVEEIQASCNDTEAVEDAPTDLVGISVVEEANPVEEATLHPGPPGDKDKDKEGPKIVPPPPTGPSVVGRGDEQEFANDPIRRTLSTDMAGWYDLWLSSLSSSSWYTYETQTCNRTVQWNLKASPWVVSLDLQALRTALEGTTCPRRNPMSGNATAAAATATETVLQASRSATMISKVCPLATAIEESAGTAWTPLWSGLFGMLGLGMLATSLG